MRIYEEAQESVIQVTKFFALKGMTDEFHVPLLYAKPYLDLCGDADDGISAPLAGASGRPEASGDLPGPPCRRMPKPSRKSWQNNRSAAFYFGKIASARFFINQVLTQAHGRARAIMNNDKSALEMPEYGLCAGVGKK